MLLKDPCLHTYSYYDLYSSLIRLDSCEKPIASLSILIDCSTNTQNLIGLVAIANIHHFHIAIAYHVYQSMCIELITVWASNIP